MEDFIDIVFPPLILLLVAAAVIFGIVVLVQSKTRVWAAQRKQVTSGVRLLNSAADVLAAVISSADTSEDIRRQALTVYSEINEAKGSK